MTSSTAGWGASSGQPQESQQAPPGQQSQSVQRGQQPPLTPDRVRRTEFSKAPMTRRGYNEEEVHFFQYRVADAISGSDAEKAKLRAEIERMKDYFREHGVVIDPEATDQGAQAGSAGSQEVDAASVMMMSRAQQSADSQIAQAEDYARRVVADARQQYEEILHQAQQQATEAAERAREAQSLAASGRDRSDSGQQEQLERHIAYLRTFAEVTQVQLKSVLEGLTREIDKLEGLPGEAGRPPSGGGEQLAGAHQARAW